MAVSPKGARIKGSVFEREIAELLREKGGLDAERVLLSGIRGEGDVEIRDFPLHVECKRCETLKISEWVKHNHPIALRDDKYLAIFHRKSNEQALVTLPAKDFVEILSMAHLYQQGEG